MNASEILDHLEGNRERLLMALEPLPDEALLQSGAMGEWSTADILAHLIVWESELVTALLRINQGKKPKKLLEALSDVDGYNAKRFAENRGRSLDALFEDLQGVRRNLERWLEEFSDQELEDEVHFKWGKGLPLWYLIKENSFGHEAQHLPEIEAFASRWLAEHGQDMHRATFEPS